MCQHMPASLDIIELLILRWIKPSMPVDSGSNTDIIYYAYILYYILARTPWE